MTISDSMFLFEITITDLKSYRRCNEFIVTAKFKDVFKICFKNSMLNSASKNVRLMKLKEKYRQKVSCRRKAGDNVRFLNRQSILITQKSSYLISNMKQHPLEISIYNRINSSRKLGFCDVPWSRFFVKYIRKNKKKSPLQVQGRFNIYNEINLKRIATIDMTIKLLYLGEKITNQLKTVTSDYINYSRNTQQEIKARHINLTRTVNDLSKTTSKKGINNVLKYVPMKIRSESNIICNIMPIVKKSLSYSSINHKGHNILQYILGNIEGSLNNKIYCVSYFTVENDKNYTDSPKVTETESQPASTPKIKFTRCDSKCQNVSDSAYSLDLSEGAAQIDITKCKGVNCNSRDHRKLPPPPDDRILLDLTNTRIDCCEKIEEIVGGVSTKMKIGDDPCFCTCECTFGFVKKTTYCNICGGYEIIGDELTRKPESEMPIPCPFFHKLVDKSKLKTWSTSGSEGKRKDDLKVMKTSSSQKGVTSDKRTIASDKKSVESEKDSKKGKKINQNNRFKFNYGYKGIPPQIGHSKCALPCSGTLDNVPKNMGWLWTSENIPGMKVHHQWRPGAVSKKILRILNKAKLRKPKVEITKPIKRVKKQIEDKPTLVVCKRNGAYHVQMQPPISDNSSTYKPLVYKIESTNNMAKIQKKETFKNDLIRDAVKGIWSDFYYPELCEQACLKDTIDLPEKYFDEETDINEYGTCDEKEDCLSYKSSDIDWEIQFTPPLMSYEARRHKGGISADLQS